MSNAYIGLKFGIIDYINKQKINIYIFILKQFLYFYKIIKQKFILRYII